MRARSAVLTLAWLLPASPALSQDSTDELAKQLQNPVSTLISVPIQGNFEFRGGSRRDGFQWTTNVQPVVPFELSQDWTLVVRTILPIVDRSGYGVADGTGLGDTTQSFFLNPTQSSGGLVLGAGPVFLWPTATNDQFGGGQWGAGPTAVALVQRGSWTVGGLANHIWSFAGSRGRRDVNATFFQPFASYSFGGGFTATASADLTYGWVGRTWTIPLTGSVSQVFKIGGQAMSASVGARYYVDRPDGVPSWGLRAGLTFLFPS